MGAQLIFLSQDHSVTQNTTYTMTLFLIYIAVNLQDHQSPAVKCIILRGLLTTVHSLDLIHQVTVHL